VQFDSLLSAVEKMNYNGKYAQHTRTTWTHDRCSHDEMVAVLYILSQSKNGKQKINDIKIGYYLKYYQVLFVLLALKNKGNPLKYLFTFLNSVYMAAGSVSKNESSKGVFDTDGDLLYFLKSQALLNYAIPVPFQKFIERNIIKNWATHATQGKKHTNITLKKSAIRALLTQMNWDRPDHPLRDFRNE